MLKVVEVNGETWWFDGRTRISEAEYLAQNSDKAATEQGGNITRNFVVALDGKLTEVVENGVD